MAGVVSLKQVSDDNFLLEQRRLKTAYLNAAKDLDETCAGLLPDQYAPIMGDVSRRAFLHVGDTPMMYPDGIAIHFDRALTSREEAAIPKNMTLHFSGRVLARVPVIIGKHDTGAPR